MKLSKFGTKLTSKTGILQLMDDLGKALAGEEKMYMLGGGNPAHIPEVEKIYKARMQEILDNGEFEKMIGNYTTPQGDQEFIESVAELFRKEYGWNISKKNICILNGSQTTFFFLFNLLAGEYQDGSFKKILLPIVPEYIGYEDQGISEGFFKGIQSKIDILDKHSFKYRIDFSKVEEILNQVLSAVRQGQDDDSSGISAICVSRPTNPTGNVVTDEEVKKLAKIAEENSIPLIIDNAYGVPFPEIIFTETKPFWNENIIYVMTLSKIGLPSTRTSIVIANEEIINYLVSINAIASLAPVTTGQYLTLKMIQDGSILDISKNIIKPFYKERSEKAVKFLHQNINSKIPYYLHKSEGALFLWLWCKDLPITSMELYERLKKQNVLVVPGEYFFPGYKGQWKHKTECLRITYSQNWEDVYRGLEIIAKEINNLYS